MDRSRTKDGESGDGSFREIFTCESGIENLQMSEELKQKLSRLCAKVDKTFRLSPSQRLKVMQFSEHIEEANLIEKCKVPLGIWRAHDSHKFNFSAFTSVECETIKENYKRFCKEFGFDPKRDINIFLPSTHATHNGIDALKKKDLQVFYFYISRNMPDRAPRSIYTKFVKIFYAYRTGP
uniref:Uncharacterized protein n=1 Tax=Lygus hesperus TaxID=30085 RepID=A0A146LMX8_LYGHE